jgi:histidinol-phosphate aminotransferase
MVMIAHYPESVTMPSGEQLRRTLVSEQSPRFRPVLDQFAGYKPGKAPALSAGRTFKLSSNESPYEPLPSVRAVLADAAIHINRYPDNGAAELTEAIASRFRVPASHVAVGCGSVGIAQQLLEAVGEPGAEVIYAWRSFEAYPYLTDLANATSVPVPLLNHGHDLAAMAAAITDHTRLIFVCTPNNPTGTSVRHAELAEFLDRVPADCLVVIDEAYAQYVRDPEIADGLRLYASRPNVAVLRTFSKAYGLAGLRVGFLVGHEPVAQAVRKTMLPFTVNSLAQAAAVASLAAESELLERVELVVKERDRVRHELLGDGWTVPPTEANFVWLPLGERSADFSDHCDATGVSVRPYTPDGVRVTIADPEANDAFLAAAARYPHRA